MKRRKRHNLHKRYHFTLIRIIKNNHMQFRFEINIPPCKFRPYSLITIKDVGIKSCNIIYPVQALKYCNPKLTPESKIMQPDYVSPNQKLVGKPMPRTEVAPIIVPPTNCLDFWKPNDFIIQSGIKRVVYLEEYRNVEGIDLLKKASINVQHIII